MTFEEVVLEQKDLESLKEFISSENVKYIAFDTETNSSIEKTATLWGLSFCFSNEQSFYLPIRDNKSNILCDLEVVKDFVSFLSKYLLVMHNGIYDILVVKNNLGIDLTNSLYHDTILSKHLFDEERPHGLKEVAVKYLGPQADKAQKELYASIEKNGGKTTKDNTEMYLADTDVLAKYGCWDAYLTYKLFLLFEAKLKAEPDQEKLYYQDEIMPLYKEVVIPMKEKGFPIDVEHFKNLQKEISIEIADIEAKLYEELSPIVKEYEKTVLQKELKITFRSELGKLLMKTYGYTKETLPDTATCIENHLTTCEEFYKTKNEVKSIFNLASNHHLAWLIYDKLGIECEEFTEKGAKKVSASILEEISSEHSFIKKLQDWKKLEKLKSTYIDGILDRQIDGVLYTSFLMFGTTSGRFSSVAPNIMNLPREKEEEEVKISALVLKYSNAIKEGFIAGKDKLICNADYSQLEPCAFAAESGDFLLQKAFKDKLDLYSSIAIEVNKLKDKYSANKKAENYLKNHRPELRQKFKAIALGIVYGAEEFRVASLLECDIDEAKEVIDQYLDTYQGLKSYMKKCDNSVFFKGYVSSRFGRKRRLPEAQRLYKTFGTKLLDRRFANKNDLKDVRWKLKNSLNLAKNHPIQSLAAHIVNRACIAMTREFKKRGIDAYIAGQVHDEITVIGDKSRIEEIRDIVKDKMENTTIIEVPLVAEPKIAYNWREAK